MRLGRPLFSILFLLLTGGVIWNGESVSYGLPGSAAQQYARQLSCVTGPGPCFFLSLSENKIRLVAADKTKPLGESPSVRHASEKARLPLLPSVSAPRPHKKNVSTGFEKYVNKSPVATTLNQFLRFFSGPARTVPLTRSVLDKRADPPRAGPSLRAQG